ncbi:MAG: bifunctional hydroxymethylpyrimidine kinase/phosphomethylpyrimidine kinase [Deltaproteobacteria bacterium]|nr:bifunctional hydroxymethylpyrimidine kinase/phosphomethylpyrimidine kinase [Deltaproteobacteria bacterium]
MKTVLIIAGSDPGAGAGLQQDLKTATLLGAYGLTVTCALTVQNSLGVSGVHPVPSEVVAAQLDAVLGDFPIHAVKLGMLAGADIVRTVAARLKEHLGEGQGGGTGANRPPAPSPRHSLPLILDPLLAAGRGEALLDDEGMEAVKRELFPLTTILTPNVPEAARLTGMAIDTPVHLEEAARRLAALGPAWVLAKGGHLAGEPVDVLTDGKNAYHLTGERLEAPHHHGSGCLLATALAAHLAQGQTVPEAVHRARHLVRQALRYGLPLGRGVGPVNPYAPFAREAARYRVLQELNAAAARLAREDISPLIPEVMSNLGYAAPYAEGPGDVAAFPGRILKTPNGALIPAPPAFGASRHLAAVILTAGRTHPEVRAAMNVRYIEGIEELAPLLHLKAAGFDRAQEPPEVKAREGGTLAWGVGSVLANLQPWEPPPDIIFDRGEVGKEPMLRILGRTPGEVAEKALALKNALQVGGAP